ncbi:helix-turn-helix domain-containing protein [Streptomyces sp. NEAU-Y11]|uniref:helix-turn-helix domain-containing protein n=1 Tax=Streptomyces cucumeris TaxID=2962890 RepID=UPI0020C8CDAA|nr:helix-turn-helix transcriptional regulator [Streptomyces sp. NEAU-Y11]MCP9209677.1 helix-turn-helix domain-containing protein [Streptomyces sp. NEAU-Y11]
MKLKDGHPISRMAEVRQSVEVRHARRGLGVMLRRGLHGAKNWALELEGDGTHRSVWSKAFRAFVVLLPVWILLTPATGGSGRGGGSMGVPEALFMAVLCALCGLAALSARERRLGREEPWLEMADSTTRSDGPVITEAEEGSSFKGGVSLVKSQVSGRCEEGERSVAGDVSDNTDDSSHIDATALPDVMQQATSDEGLTLTPEDLAPPFGSLRKPVQQAITEGAAEAGLDRTFEAGADVPPEALAEVLHATPIDPTFSQVEPDVEPLRRGVAEDDSSEGEPEVSGITKSDDPVEQNGEPLSLQERLRVELREEDSIPASAQVKPEEESLREPLQGALQVQYAAPGPYPPQSDPIALDWWATRPDPPEVDPSVAPGQVNEPEAGTKKDTVEDTVEDAVEDERLPEPVLLFLASQSNASSFSDKARESARIGAIAWARREVEGRKRSQAEVAKMLGTHKSTVSRWLTGDPFDED